MKRALLVAALFCSIALQALEPQRLKWRDRFESRLGILALLQTLNGEILASSSATRTLEAWCGEHRMADDPKIVAKRVPDVRKEPSAEQVQRLGVRDASELQYRGVELRCGAHVLSVADNWYVPARLTPEMNALLTTTENAVRQSRAGAPTVSADDRRDDALDPAAARLGATAAITIPLTWPVDACDSQGGFSTSRRPLHGRPCCIFRGGRDVSSGGAGVWAEMNEACGMHGNAHERRERCRPPSFFLFTAGAAVSEHLTGVCHVGQRQAMNADRNAEAIILEASMEAGVHRRDAPASVEATFHSS